MWRKVSGIYTAEGITALADALRVCGSMTSLNISGNNISVQSALLTEGRAEGAKTIAEDLKDNSSLTSVRSLAHQIAP